MGDKCVCIKSLSAYGIGMRGIVTSLKATASKSSSACTIIDMEDATSTGAEIGIRPNVYDILEFKTGLHEGIGSPKLPKLLGESAHDEYVRVMSEIISKMHIDQNTGKISAKSGMYAGLDRLLPSLSHSAARLARSLSSGSPVVVRFHNDGDGSSGAIALYKAVKQLADQKLCVSSTVSWRMNRGISYSMESVSDDAAYFSLYSSAEKPLVVIIDFGTSDESDDAMSYADGKIDIIWIDHHPIPKGFRKEGVFEYINPWDIGSDSNLTAGVLGCILASLLSGESYDDMEKASLTSDYSAYADPEDESSKSTAALLDFLTSNNGMGRGKKATPKQIISILDDSEKRDETLRLISNAFEESIKEGIRTMERYVTTSGVPVNVVDFNRITVLGFGYPPMGKYSSRLHDRLEHEAGAGAITVVHGGSYISLRISKSISGSVLILERIEELKGLESLNVTGGGHNEAASIKCDPKQIDDVIESLLAVLSAVKPPA